MFLLIKQQADQPIQTLGVFKTAYEACLAMVEQYRKIADPYEMNSSLSLHNQSFAEHWINTPEANKEGSFDVIALPVNDLHFIFFWEEQRKNLVETLPEYKWYDVEDEVIRDVVGRADWVMDDDDNQLTFTEAILQVMDTHKIAVPLWTSSG